MAMTKNRSRPLVLLLLAALVFFVLSRIPFGNYIQWPFVIITTFIHEMGHGLTAIILGGELVKVEIYQNASGVAWTRVLPGWQQAAVAAGGLLAPSIAGSVFILAGRTPRASSLVFIFLSVFILISCLIWVRSFFGLAVLIPVSLIFIWIARRKDSGLDQFFIQFMGVHMLVDTFTRTLPYIFSSTANAGGRENHSDSSAIAEHLVGGHFLWACIIALSALFILAWSLRITYLKSSLA